MKKNKLLAILVLCVFLFGIPSGVLAKPTGLNIDVKVNDNGSVTMTFNDADQAKWALQQILKMKAENIISGFEDGSFRPNKTVTRAQAVVLTMRAAGLQTEIENIVADSVYLPFKDAKSIPVYAKKAVALAVQKGYLGADGSGSFQAEKAASREWVVVLIAKSMGLKPMDIDLPFTDADKISSDAAGYVAVVVYNHSISGLPDGSFQPQKPVTRAEIAVMLGLAADEVKIPGKIKSKVEGTVKSVSTSVYSDVYSQGTITLTVNGDKDDEVDEDVARVVTLQVAKNAQIYIGDKTAAIGDIAVGSKAEIAVNKNGLAVYIEIKPITVKGVVQSVYAGEKSLTIIQRTGEEKMGNKQLTTYQVADSVNIVVNGVKVELAQLLPDDVVKLNFNADGKVTSIKASRFTKIKDKIKDKMKNKEDEEKNTERNAERNTEKNNEKNKEKNNERNTEKNQGGHGNNGGIDNQDDKDEED